MAQRFKICARKKVAIEALSPEWREKWEETYNVFFAQFSDLGDDAADAAAGSATVKKLQHEINETKRRLQLQRIRRAELLREAEAFRGKDALNKNAHLAAFMKRAMENMGGRAGKEGASVQGRYKAVLGRAHAMLADVIEKFEAGADANLFHLRNRVLLDDVGRHVFGEATDNLPAAALGEAWKDTAEYLRKMFNVAGGDIGKLERWGLPTSHEATKVVRAMPRNAKLSVEENGARSMRAWIDFITPLVSLEHTIDSATGAPILPARLELALQDMYKSIVSEGRAGLKPGQEVPGKASLARQHREHRFIQFKSYDAWKAYQERFGNPDAYSVMMGHIDMMARDIAAIQVLGPNPRGQLEWLQNEALRQGGVERADGHIIALERAKRMSDQAVQMYDTYMAAFNSPDGENITAPIMASIRSLLTTAQLGSAVLLDLPSAPVFGHMGRAIAGLNKHGRFGDFVAMLNPADESGRAIARRTGMIVDSANEGLVNQLYYTESLNTGVTHKLPAAMLNIVGNSGFQTARKRAFMMEFLGQLADLRHKSLDDLLNGTDVEPLMARTFKRWGVTAEEWNKIRGTKMAEPEAGAPFLDLAAVENDYGHDLAFRVSEMIQQEMVRVVPERTLYSRSQVLMGTQAGTIKGELIRSLAMYRGFVVTLNYTYGMEMAAKIAQDGALSGVKAGVAGMLALTMAAALGMQAREIVKGNTPKDMDRIDFWQAAMMQGGGLGLLGDFFQASTNRFGQTGALAGLGPVGAFASDTIDTANHSLAMIGANPLPIEGKPNPARRAATWWSRYAPWASIWWARAAWDRVVIAQLRYATDPKADEYYDRMAKRLEKTGQSMWLEPAGYEDHSEHERAQ